VSTTLFIWAAPILLISQQATVTLSSRAKVSGSAFYCAWTAVLSHSSWIFSNALILFPVGKYFSQGASLEAFLMAFWYVLWATVGNVLGQWWGLHVERKKGIL
jgi:hypothetical protein